MLYQQNMRAFAVLIALFTTTAVANATSSDWKKHVFDFHSPTVNFEADVPAGSRVETVPMDDTEPGALGKVKIVGKVSPGANGPRVGATIMAYDLRSPPAALPICKYEAEIAGYTPRSMTTSPDLTEAKIFATQSDNGKPKGALLSHCFAKGHNALALHFVVNVTEERSPAAARKALEELDAYSKAFLKNFKFSDGKQANFGAAMQRVPLRIGERAIRLQVPKEWSIPINDFRGPLPAELHMVRRSGGKDVGLIWLSVQDMKEKPDLETTGAAIIRDYFVKQTPDADPPVLLGASKNSDLLDHRLENREFRFSVRNRKGEDVGAIHATAVWKDGQLTVISQWSAWAESARRNDFFSRLPGVTTYDLVRAAIFGVRL